MAWLCSANSWCAVGRERVGVTKIGCGSISSGICCCYRAVIEVSLRLHGSDLRRPPKLGLFVPKKLRSVPSVVALVAVRTRDTSHGGIRVDAYITWYRKR